MTACDLSMAATIPAISVAERPSGCLARRTAADFFLATISETSPLFVNLHVSVIEVLPLAG
jgi:hypothetical protein